MFNAASVRHQLQIADLKLDLQTGQVWQGEDEISLPKLSYQLLRVLAENAPNVMTQEDIIQQVWPDMVVGDETLKQRVRLLRKAISDNAQSPQYISVVRGVGYRLIPEVKVILTPRATPIEYELASSDHPPEFVSSRTTSWWQFVSLSMAGFIIFLFAALISLSIQMNDRAHSYSIRNLAILPFVNVTQNKEDEYLASGMTNELINTLSAVKTLNVVPKESVSTYQNSERIISDIARQLQVGTILDGALFRKNNLIYLNFKLIDTSQSTLLWQAEYNFASDDILAIQRKVITQVTSHLKTKLDASAILDNLSLTQPSQVVQAYHYYLQGENYYSRYRQQDNATAISLYQKSLELEPDFGLAYAGLADALSQGVFQFGAGDTWLQQALEAAQRAVELVPNKAESHKAQGLALFLDGRLNQSIASNLRAIKLAPRHAQAITNLAYLFSLQGKIDKALQWNLRALEVAPDYATVHAHLGNTYALGDQLLKAEKSYLKAIQLQPDYSFAIKLYARFLATHGQLPTARNLVHQALEKSPNETALLSAAGEIELIHGYFFEAHQYFQQAIHSANNGINRELSLLNTISLLGLNNLSLNNLSLNNLSLNSMLPDPIEPPDETHPVDNLDQSSQQSKPTFHTLLSQPNQKPVAKDELTQLVSQQTQDWQNYKLSISEKPYDHYLLALLYAANNQLIESRQQLQIAFDKGWRNYALLESNQLLRTVIAEDNIQQQIINLKLQHIKIQN
ncbi:winged helix-turn-helix domain-containing tetratricopeptide repeat protein [Aliikangiella maris]|uniref:Winged helix-turn-helix domain-containing protein n=2 Tax=Aliikangiella maris TaxID=3162458 RepID=A0ABV2BSK9_9GAMM